jgi:tetratricopeptide (TPR) repeat protein
MESSAEFNRSLEQAATLRAQGRLAEAEQICRQLLSGGERREPALRALVELYMQMRRFDDAVNTLVALTGEVPDELYYFARLAALLEGAGRLDEAIGHYRRLIERRPDLAAAHFNLARLLRQSKLFDEAIAAYENALELGIDSPEEACCNLGVLYSDIRRPDAAERMYRRALEAAPGHVPALFNLAGLHEESGRRDEAARLYRDILSVAPGHAEALARLAHLRKASAADAELLESLRRAAGLPDASPLARESALFALGKMLDDQERYDEAFKFFQEANELGRKRFPPYDRRSVERMFDRFIEAFPAEHGDTVSGVAAESPIFICGMFRSGSTLVEQILSGHPSIMAGGELDCLPWLLARRMQPYPERAAAAAAEELSALGSEYLSMLRYLFPGCRHVTDKRPDNFLHLGLIHRVFPNARIIFTHRNAVDNCLSIYFQQLGGNLNYATDLESTAHYYRQHERLMRHWRQSFGERIHTVDYDALVRNLEPAVRALLSFLGLDWDDRCLGFRTAGTPVKTASVWQVRGELHSLSSGRWQNYARHLDVLQRALEADPA